MAYRIVMIQDQVVTGLDGRPVRGHLVTISDDETGDTFNMESVTDDPAAILNAASVRIANRKQIFNSQID